MSLFYIENTYELYVNLVSVQSLTHWGLLRQRKKNRVGLLSRLITSTSEMFITITGVTIASIISEISFATRHFGLCSGVRYFVFKCYPSCCRW